MTYKHGNYANIIASQANLPPDGVTTLPVYIGAAPIQQLAATTGKINSVVKVNSFEEAKAALGYSDDWSTFRLCEAMYAHFKNEVESIGPIIMINVLDPTVNKAAGTPQVFGTAQGQTPLVNNKAYLTSQKVITSTCTATDGDSAALVKGTDFKVEYQSDGKALITLLKVDAKLPVTLSFDEVTAVQSTDVIGEYDSATGTRKGVYVVDLVYQETGMVPTILSAPGLNSTATVRNALISRAQNINGHFDCLVVTDLDASADTATIDEALIWKETNGYGSIYEKTAWPLVKSSAGKVFHISTIMAVTMQEVDYKRDNVPSESPSNKLIDTVSLVLADGTTTVKFDELQANTLNEKGVTTAVYRGGGWRLWGPHNSNYDYAAEVAPENIFDCTIRMQQYLKNEFFLRFLNDVDAPFDRRKVDSIINDAQMWIDSLVSDGHLLSGSVSFNPGNNSTASLVDGDFVFDVKHTTTPPGKSITFNIQYITDGLVALTGGEA